MCRCSSVVEQLIRNERVVSSTLISGSNEIKPSGLRVGGRFSIFLQFSAVERIRTGHHKTVKGFKWHHISVRGKC